MRWFIGLVEIDWVESKQKESSEEENVERGHDEGERFETNLE